MGELWTPQLLCRLQTVQQEHVLATHFGRLRLCQLLKCNLCSAHDVCASQALPQTLVHLSVSRNALPSLAGIQGLVSLQWLDASCNQIQVPPSSWSEKSRAWLAAPLNMHDRRDADMP